MANKKSVAKGPRIHIAVPGSAQRQMREDPRHSSIAILASPQLTSDYDNLYIRRVLDAAVLGPQGFDESSNGRIVLPRFQDGQNKIVQSWCLISNLPVKILSSTGKFAAGATIPVNDNSLPASILWEARRAIFFWDGVRSPISEGLEAAWRMASVVKMKVYIKEGKRFVRLNLKTGEKT